MKHKLEGEISESEKDFRNADNSKILLKALL